MMNADLLDRWRGAPRLTSFSRFFEETATGRGGAPDLKTPLPDMSLLDFDIDCLVLWDTHRKLWGHFDHHYFASIPFRLEEEIRLGASLLPFLTATWGRRGREGCFYSLGAGTGCLARTLAKLGGGRIKTLCCSPTDGNRISFDAKRGSEDAIFFHGPFFELDETRYQTDDSLVEFRDGFDVLFEDTTFQMYGPDRLDQLAFIAPRIRPGGILVQVQKINLEDGNAYFDRERQKDELFKSQFFSGALIDNKKQDVVDHMMALQVGMAETVLALKSFFRYSVITWNSGNFYTILSSNDRSSLQDLRGQMLAPAIPPAFCYEELPRVLLGTQDLLAPIHGPWRAARRIHGEDAREPIIGYA